MFKAECWIERVQVSYNFVKEFTTLQEAQDYCAKDFGTRGKMKNSLEMADMISISKHGSGLLGLA